MMMMMMIRVIQGMIMSEANTEATTNVRKLFPETWLWLSTFAR